MSNQISFEDNLKQWVRVIQTGTKASEFLKNLPDSQVPLMRTARDIYTKVGLEVPEEFEVLREALLESKDIYHYRGMFYKKLAQGFHLLNWPNSTEYRKSLPEEFIDKIFDDLLSEWEILEQNSQILEITKPDLPYSFILRHAGKYWIIGEANIENQQRLIPQINDYYTYLLSALRRLSSYINPRPDHGDITITDVSWDGLITITYHNYYFKDSYTFRPDMEALSHNESGEGFNNATNLYEVNKIITQHQKSLPPLHIRKLKEVIQENEDLKQKIHQLEKKSI